MKKFKHHHLPGFLFFAVCIVFLGSMLYYLFLGATGKTDSSWTATAHAAPQPPAALAPGDHITLQAGQAKQIGQVKLVYRGVQRNKLSFDVYLLALDPHYPYQHTFDLKTARSGFQVGRHTLQLLSARKSWTKIKWLATADS